jgi:hypothetical protein
VGSFAHVLSKVANKGFFWIHKINVDINILISTSMFNQIWARLLATMVAKMAS